jgi:hypothetical protein
VNEDEQACCCKGAAAAVAAAAAAAALTFAINVVDLPLLLITEDVIRLSNLFELLLCVVFVVRMLIRVPFASLVPVRLLYVLRRGALVYTQYCVVV